MRLNGHGCGIMINKLFKKSTKRLNVAICCIAKNEDLYIIEWLRYHFSLGVQKIYIYDNESQIPLREQLADFTQSDRVKVLEFPGTSMQFKAYRHCLGRYGKCHDWIAFIDVDEFIFPKTTDGDLPAFLERYSQYGGLGVNWRVFASNNHQNRPSVSQVAAFTRRAAKRSEISMHIKSIVQPRHVMDVGTDPHHFVYREKMFCVNETFERIEGPFHPHSSNLSSSTIISPALSKNSR